MIVLRSAGTTERSSCVLTEIRTFADGGDLAQDVETRHVRERARADTVQTPGEELPVDGVKRRMRNLHLDLARARGGQRRKNRSSGVYLERVPCRGNSPLTTV